MNKFTKSLLVAGTAFLLSASFLGIENLFTRNNVSQRENQPITKDYCPSSTNKPRTIRITNWNLQAFGTKKASKPKLMEEYKRAITNSDIIFLQEIRDNTGNAFRQLYSTLSDYNSTNSSRAGRSNTKEQYGVLYKKEIKLIKFEDFNPVFSNLWERPPICASFAIGDYTVRVYNVHTKPEAVKAELKNLEALTIASTNENVVILGDLNASGNYYNRVKEKDFLTWHWIIGDKEDTTVAKSINAYDRIILNENASREFISYSIYTNVQKEVSDHYPISLDLVSQEQ